ncbi:MAG: hypothetical protein IMY71_06845 [Bacteroidetes bacterium]|nr:hypothetical protein [Bacteroidota bacterium]
MRYESISLEKEHISLWSKLEAGRKKAKSEEVRRRPARVRRRRSWQSLISRGQTESASDQLEDQRYDRF